MKMEMLTVSTLIIAILCCCFLTRDVADADSYNTWISDEYVQICEEVGEIYHVSPELLIAMIETESSGQQYARNGSCSGLMQVSTTYHADRMARLGFTDIFDPRTNITVGTDYLVELFEEYEDPYMVLGVYNGQSNAIKKVESGIYSDYATKIMKRARELEKARGKV